MYGKTFIVGRLTDDPELKSTPNGVAVTSFSVAVDRSYSAKGEQRKVDFYSVIAWRETANFICRWFSKGNPVLIEGRMESREYTDKKDVKHRVWELIAERVSFVGSKQEQRGADVGREVQAVPAQAAVNDVAAPATDDFEELSDDSDLPF